jgi:hypothetical protein
MSQKIRMLISLVVTVDKYITDMVKLIGAFLQPFTVKNATKIDRQELEAYR